jgi:hypothetical protein
MSNEFDLFASADDVVESGDFMPSDNFGTQDTGLYPVGIKAAYMGESAGGAKCINFQFQNADGTGPEIKQTIYMTTKKSTGCRTTYIDRSGGTHKLAGMEQIDNLCEMLTGMQFQELAKTTAEDKVVKIWDFDEKADVNTDVRMIMGLLNKPVLIGLHKVKENTVKLIDKEWKPQAKERWSNEIDKFFDADTGLTHAEMKAKLTNPDWLAKWKAKYIKTPPWFKDKYKPVDDEIADDFAAAGGGTTDTKTLFP